ncbi:phosphoglycolate phosphatase [Parasporobacterium paucivorans DSM 15970]|uniref:Phosphoglycolate phosphatase n=2 Tax=Parasporobacterium TaxID=115543 RepID=A0A1M6HKF3_9FIRM|nr:phosphoglycolate phosphatase [Parasporobacterium paucivorans DSM 15970]
MAGGDPVEIPLEYQIKCEEEPMKYEYLLFDLDGTLTDSGKGITNSVAYALDKFQINVTDKAELNRFVGPPLVDAFMEYYSFSLEEARLATKYYREYFTRKGMFENTVYDGVEEMLHKLKESGRHLLVATSKPEPFSVKILEYFKLSAFFDVIAGSTLYETRVNKAEVIAYALSSAGITEKEKTVMIGDRKHDIIGARKNGIDSIGVLYGYGCREEFEAENVSYIVETVAKLYELIK